MPSVLDLTTTLLFGPTAVAHSASAVTPDACAPDCTNDFMCDSTGRYFERQCCFQPDCTYFCQAWVQIGNC